MTYLDYSGGVPLVGAKGEHSTLLVHDHGFSLHVVTLDVEALGRVHDGNLLWEGEANLVRTRVKS